MYLGRARVISEQTIGILKVRIQLAARKDMGRILSVIMACSCLHSLLLLNEVPSDWLEGESSEEDTEACHPALTIAQEADNSRGTQIHEFIVQYQGVTSALAYMSTYISDFHSSPIA
jgi:hypothetical protein